MNCCFSSALFDSAATVPRSDDIVRMQTFNGTFLCIWGGLKALHADPAHDFLDFGLRHYLFALLGRGLVGVLRRPIDRRVSLSTCTWKTSRSISMCIRTMSPFLLVSLLLLAHLTPFPAATLARTTLTLSSGGGGAYISKLSRLLRFLPARMQRCLRLVLSMSAHCVQIGRLLVEFRTCSQNICSYMFICLTNMTPSRLELAASASSSCSPFVVSSSRTRKC